MTSKRIQSITNQSANNLFPLRNKRKSFMKKFLRRSLVIAITIVIANVFFANRALSQVTKTWTPTTGGNWLTATNWSPNGVPAATDVVLIPNNQSAAITRTSANNEIVSLRGLIISGNVNLQFDPGTANVTTLNITETFTVDATKTLTVGINNTGRLNLTIASGATGTVNGTVFMNSFTSGGGFDRVFTNSGNLTVSLNGLITGQNTSQFVLSSGATLQIANAAGITTTGATGAIQLPGTRTYTAGANYVYNGAANQVTGNGFTQNQPASVTIANTGSNGNNTVTLSATRTISGNLSVSSGIFDLGANSINRSAAGGTLTVSNGATLRIGGTNSFPTNYSTHTLAASSTIEYNGTNQGVTTETYGNLTLSSSGNKTFAGATTIGGILSISGTAVALLANGTTSTANTLTLGGVGQTNGSWGGTASAATHKNATFFGTTTTGAVNVAQQACTPPAINGTLTTCGGLTTQLTSPDAPATTNPWVSATTSVATITNTGLVTGVAGGTSIITFTNSTGCSNTATVTVNGTPTTSSTKNDVQCFNTNTGQIVITASNGTSPFTYSIDNGVNYVNNGGTFNGLGAGTYKIRVKDANGCESRPVQ